jgi:four helix bundle protein
MFSFENLAVYQKARKLVKVVYGLQKMFPAEERYALGDQIRRSIVSVTSNIAEGAGRDSYKEKIHFIEISFGSLMEAFSQLQIAQDLGYVSEDDVEIVRPMFEEVGKMLSGLKSSFGKNLVGRL